jgi:redox-sensitive bicupin YhaK (pirin superfamily)
MPTLRSSGELEIHNFTVMHWHFQFGQHPNSFSPVCSYILDGQLLHEDSLGHHEVLSRGQVQFTTTGSGIHHSEFNANKDRPVKFLQIWVTPHTRGLKPGYQTGTFEEASKKDRLRRIISPDGAEGSLKINADMSVFATLLGDGATVTHSFGDAKRRGYIHVPIMAGTRGVTVKGSDGAAAELAPGDGAFITDEESVEITGHTAAPGASAELLLFDLA